MMHSLVMVPDIFPLLELESHHQAGHHVHGPLNVDLLAIVSKRGQGVNSKGPECGGMHGGQWSPG